MWLTKEEGVAAVDAGEGLSFRVGCRLVDTVEIELRIQGYEVGEARALRKVFLHLCAIAHHRHRHVEVVQVDYMLFS